MIIKCGSIQLDASVRLWHARRGVQLLQVPEEGPSWPLSSINFNFNGSLLLTTNYSNCWYNVNTALFVA